MSFQPGKLITSKAKQKKFEKYKKIKQQIRRGERFLAVNNFVAAIETYKKLKRQFNLLKEDEKRAVYKDILDYYSKVAKKVGREQMPVIQSPMSPRIKIIRKRKKQKPKKKRGR